MILDPPATLTKNNAAVLDALHPFDYRMAYSPWIVAEVFCQVEKLLKEIETTGAIDDINGAPQFLIDGAYYDACENLGFLIEYHQLAFERYGVPASLAHLKKFVAKLKYNTPLFESDISGCRSDIASCAAQFMRLLASEARDLALSVNIRHQLADLNIAQKSFS